MSEQRPDCHDPCPVIALREPVEEVATLLRWLQFGLLRHPGLVRPLVRSLIAEGTRFAATDAGRDWNDRIERSDMMKELRTYWESMIAPHCGPEPSHAGAITARIDDFMAALRLGQSEAALAAAFLGVRDP